MKSLAKINKFLLYLQNMISAPFKKKYTWTKTATGIKYKGYSSYNEYMHHQQSKLSTLGNDWLSWYDSLYMQTLYKRLLCDDIPKKATVLCLAARIGTEVKSFLKLGYFAVGIDLNPGKENKYVVYGDFHNLQFSNKTVDVVFTNSLDHAFDLTKIANEIVRVLIPKGLFILEITHGEKDKNSYNPGSYEATYWEKLDSVLKIFTDKNFKIISRKSYKIPWPGEHIIMKLSE